MKKVLLGLLFIVPFVFAGCNDSPLNKTKWVYEYSKGNYSSVETLEFSKNEVAYTIEEREDGKDYINSAAGTYTYNKPNLSITIDGMTLEGIISDNKFITEGTDGEAYVFIKK